MKPDTELFALHANENLDKHVSWYHKARALAVDPVSLIWSNGYFYMFFTFNIIGQTIATIT